MDVDDLRSRRLGLVAGLLAVLVVAVLEAPNLLAALRTYDGGIAASAGTFTLHGLTPYRDYWLLYGPLGGIVVALPTAVLGPSVELIRVLGLVAFLAQAGVAYLIARVWTRPLVAALIAIMAVVMLPPFLGLELSAWVLALTCALGALYVSIGTRRPGWWVGLLVGLAFAARFDVGLYALLAVLVARDRRGVLLGFSAVALPILIWAIATTDLGSLWEQLVWYPVIGPRQFRGFPGPDTQYGSAAILLEIPLLVVPRLLIVASAATIALAAVRRDVPVAARLLLPLTIFAGLCQLQTQGRADVEHLAQAATPAILLMAYWYRQAPMGLPRFAVLVSVAIPCLLVGSLGLRWLGQTGVPKQDADILAASAWIQAATDRDEPIYVGLTSHRYTVMNPLLVYYLADRRAAVRDAMFNPGVTNTSWGQTRMIDDLTRSSPDYLILDRDMADLRESTNDSQAPGSAKLDAYIGNGYHPVCDMGSLVIEARNGLTRTMPPCPAMSP